MSESLLKQVIHDELNLYNLLELPLDKFTKISTADLKRQYRKLSLKYHPDKTTDQNAERFHAVSMAMQILGEDHLRSVYDKWLGQYIRDNKDRNKMITRLKTRERAPQKKSGHYDLNEMQKYGEQLRKLKHFRMSYGDWQHLNLDTDPEEHSLYDSCTLRFEVWNEKLKLRNNQELKDYVLKKFNFVTDEIFDVYYSERNEYRSHDSNVLAIYVVFKTPLQSRKEFDQCRNLLDDEVIDVSPRTPLHYYPEPQENLKFKLDDNILNAINDHQDPIVID
ncbi:hypothetical protein KAFR_0A01530 [Kazachstania africana CBS 2517]|uniref:J domain-containing protein n=1 Tax=Kazachstania africana (strain ATCC 22294 / BCRC 22015 / CBS 2517 / CECT 1963 / NBRC 1671 / NRRL Y-8276) TaxID=1071382 RepID=H2AMJ1_KAZAF|nr:hypothetical protein KAFR_0A01530 [Kazachstania africana CBS 2517]CCF55591.1 hypothetical protein KAFR_0A01530 [Kazachstania africana CBS 2517]